MKYEFIGEHRPQFSIRAMCRVLHVHPSGFYTWLKNPLSKRAIEDQRQTKLIEKLGKNAARFMGIANYTIICVI